MSDSFSQADCYFQTSDNSDGTFWISASPQNGQLKLDGRIIDIGLDLKPGTPMKEADELSALLRKYVTSVRVRHR
jgi:hypothetical protein